MLVLWLLLVVIMLCWQISRRSGCKLEPHKYPGAIPLFGHLHLFIAANRDLWAFCQKISLHCLKIDNAIALNLFFRSEYVVADPNDALTVANNYLDKNFMYDFTKPWIGNGLITATDEMEAAPQVAEPDIQFAGISKLHGRLQQTGASLEQEQMARHVSKGPFDHCPDLKQNALETICMTALGLDLTENTVVDSKYTNVVNEVIVIFLKRYFSPWLYMDFFYNQSHLKRRQDECIELLQNVSDGVIKKWRTENDMKMRDGNGMNSPGKKNKPFLEVLLELYDYHGLFTYDEVRKHVNTIIASGYETVASVLLFTLTLLGSYPCVQDRLVNEIKRVFDNTDRDVEIQDLPNLIYLEAVIKESMRTYPAVPIVARHIDREVKLKKSTLLPGHSCYLSLYTIHRHPIWGKDADEFRPERWLDPSTLPDNAKAFVAFGIGRRSCIGKTYAMMSLKTTLAHFLRRYTVTADHTKIKLCMNFLLTPVSGHEISIE